VRKARATNGKSIHDQFGHLAGNIAKHPSIFQHVVQLARPNFKLQPTESRFTASQNYL
jgi:hypothetical protein